MSLRTLNDGDLRVSGSLGGNDGGRDVVVVETVRREATEDDLHYQTLDEM